MAGKSEAHPDHDTVELGYAVHAQGARPKHVAVLSQCTRVLRSLYMRRVRVPGAGRDILYGETPYGWRLSSDRSKLVLDRDEQRLLATVRHMFFAERIRMRDIVEILREAGVVNRRGRPFGLSGVADMIHRRKDRPPEAVDGRRKRN